MKKEMVEKEERVNETIKKLNDVVKEANEAKASLDLQKTNVVEMFKRNKMYTEMTKSLDD